MSFRIKGLPAETFQHLFALSDAELGAHRALRRKVEEPFSTPCRVSLTDADPGQEVLLVNHEHHPVDSPFRSSFAVYVRAGETTYDAVDQVPDQLRRRLLSVRGYDSRGLMVEAEVVEGRELEGTIERMLAEPRTDYLHLHFAKPGCYAARVERA
jgi:hypothetical protein